MEPSTNTNVQPSGSFPGNSGIPAAPLATQSQILNSQNATWNRISDSLNQMEPSTDTNEIVVLPLLDCQYNHKVPIPNMPRGTQLSIVGTKWSLQQMQMYSLPKVFQATWNPIIDSLDQMEPSADTNIQQFGSFPGNSGIPPLALSPGNSGIPAASLEIQSQCLNYQNAPWNQMEPSIDSNVQPFGRFPGNSGIVAAGLPIQLHNQIIDNLNQKEPSADINVQAFGQPYGPPSSFLASNTEDDWINRLTWND
ncbi:hypothetical protein NL676_000023 [Syzygium grande]|nr:hypothetical protein NL676_000023 [Syzygium grande]